MRKRTVVFEFCAVAFERKNARRQAGMNTASRFTVSDVQSCQNYHVSLSWQRRFYAADLVSKAAPVARRRSDPGFFPCEM